MEVACTAQVRRIRDARWPLKIEGLAGGRPLARLSAKGKSWWHAKKAGAAGAGAVQANGQSPFLYAPIASCYQPQGSLTHLGFLSSTVRFTLLYTMIGAQCMCVAQRVQAMLLSDCRWWLGASGETRSWGWMGGGRKVDGGCGQGFTRQHGELLSGCTPPSPHPQIQQMTRIQSTNTESL